MSEPFRRVKIVQVIGDSELGGGPKHVLGLLANLNKDLFDCYLICPPGYLMREAKKIKDVEVHNVRFASKFDIPAMLTLRQTIHTIKAGRDPFGPIVVHAHGPRAGLIARFMRMRGVRYVYTEHLFTEDYRLNNSINDAIQRKLLRYLNQKTDLVIAVSTAVKRYLVSSGMAPAKRTVIIPNAAPDEALEKVKPSFSFSKTTPVIGTIGSLNAQKGHEYLIAAMPRIIQRFPLATLEIVGGGPLKDRLNRQIKQLGIERNVSLLGSQEHPGRRLKSWNVFVLPSLSETFGLAALEAMAWQKPVVTTRVGGVTDFVRHGQNALTVAPRRSDELAEAVIKLLENETIARKLAENGRATAKKYSWDNIIGNVEEQYWNLIS